MITGEDGKQQEVKLKVTSPGVYSGEIPLDETGVYSINVRNQNGEEIVKNINTATAMQYSREYRYAEVSGNLESFVENVSGRYIEKSEEVFDTKLEGSMSRRDITEWLLLAALLLFVLDVVIRRMRVDWLSAIGNGLRLAVGPDRSSGTGRKEKRKGDRRNRKDKKQGDPRSDEPVSDSADKPEERVLREAAGEGAGNKADDNKKADRKSDKPDSADRTGKTTDKKAGRKTDNKADKKSGRKTDAGAENVIDTSALLKKKKERGM